MILIVDDDARFMDIVTEELEQSGYECSFQTNVDKALKFFEENREKIDILILDMMMPPGNSFKNEETQFGFKTGYLFHSRVRRETPDLPVIILSNVSDELLFDSFSGEHNCWFYRKRDVLPFELVQIIEDILASSQ